MEDDRLRDRARGALAGVAVGDCVGAPFEGWSEVSHADLDRVLDGDSLLQYTDDTAMTIVLARSLLATGGFDGQHLSAAFAEAYAAEPWRGYGAGPPRVFEMLRRGARWDEAPSRLFGAEGSFGNGGAMRVAPVALLALGNLATTADLARRTASVTHAHDIGMDGAALLACAVGAVLDGGGDADPLAVVEAVRPHVATGELRSRLDRIPPLLDDPAPDRIAAELGHGTSAVEAVPAALTAGLAPSGSVVEAVSLAVRIGGDTDTIAAMAGALAGARHGFAAVPARLRERTEGVDELVRLADRLLDASAGTTDPGT
jgi:poly(ADP-ribose) glycohydrolase ARH3